MNKNIQKYKDLLKKEKENHRLAFVIGNGINRRINKKEKSWQDTIIGLCKDSKIDITKIPPGISETELFDIICMKSNVSEIKKAVAELFTYKEHEIDENYEIYQKAFKEKWNVPILTTNFDQRLEKGLSDKIYRKKDIPKNFSRFYPWSKYYTEENLLSKDPQKNFSIWHINGMCRYKDSIRFGLIDYMNIVAKTKDYLYPLISDNFIDEDKWKGYNTWLNIFMNSTLCIFGLSLDVNETYLRWLLIQRKIYHDKRSLKNCGGYYLAPDEVNIGKSIFLEHLGIKVVKLKNHDELYKDFLELESKEEHQS